MWLARRLGRIQPPSVVDARVVQLRSPHSATTQPPSILQPTTTPPFLILHPRTTHPPPILNPTMAHPRLILYSTTTHPAPPLHRSMTAPPLILICTHPSRVAQLRRLHLATTQPPYWDSCLLILIAPTEEERLDEDNEIKHSSRNDWHSACSQPSWMPGWTTLGGTILT